MSEHVHCTEHASKHDVNGESCRSCQRCLTREADLAAAHSEIERLEVIDAKTKDEFNSMFSGEYHLKTVRDLIAERDAAVARAAKLVEAADDAVWALEGHNHTIAERLRTALAATIATNR